VTESLGENARLSLSSDFFGRIAKPPLDGEENFFENKPTSFDAAFSGLEENPANVLISPV